MLESSWATALPFQRGYPNDWQRISRLAQGQTQDNARRTGKTSCTPKGNRAVCSGLQKARPVGHPARQCPCSSVSKLSGRSELRLEPIRHPSATQTKANLKDSDMNDWIGQINAQQARAIIIRMALAGTVTALGVLSQHLDSIVATTSPLGMALAFGIAQTLIYLNSGQTPPAPKV